MADAEPLSHAGHVWIREIVLESEMAGAAIQIADRDFHRVVAQSQKSIIDIEVEVSMVGRELIGQGSPCLFASHFYEERQLVSVDNLQLRQINSRDGVPRLVLFVAGIP